MVAHCFASAPCELLARVHDRHRIWTRFELAKGAQDRFLVGRHSLRWQFFALNVFWTLPEPGNFRMRCRRSGLVLRSQQDCGGNCFERN